MARPTTPEVHRERAALRDNAHHDANNATPRLPEKPHRLPWTAARPPCIVTERDGDSGMVCPTVMEVSRTHADGATNAHHDVGDATPRLPMRPHRLTCDGDSGMVSSTTTDVRHTNRTHAARHDACDAASNTESGHVTPEVFDGTLTPHMAARTTRPTHSDARTPKEQAYASRQETAAPPAYDGHVATRDSEPGLAQTGDRGAALATRTTTRTLGPTNGASGGHNASADAHRRGTADLQTHTTTTHATTHTERAQTGDRGSTPAPGANTGRGSQCRTAAQDRRWRHGTTTDGQRLTEHWRAVFTEEPSDAPPTEALYRVFGHRVGEIGHLPKQSDGARTCRTKAAQCTRT